MTQPFDPAAALAAAVAHHQAGRLAEAERLYRQILAAVPNHPDAHHNLGQLARQLGQTKAALPHLQAALNANPSVGQYWLSFLAALLEAGELAAARQVLALGRARGLAGAPVDALEQRLTALQATATGETRDDTHPAPPAPPEEAQNTPQGSPQTLADRAGGGAEEKDTAGEPSEPAPLPEPNETAGPATPLQGGSARADALPQHPEQDPLEPIRALRDRGEWQAAIHRLTQLLAEDLGQNPEAWALLGQLHLARKNLAEAAQAIARAEALDPDHPKVLVNRARLLLQQRKPAEALTAARQALAAQPADREARLVEIAALAASGQRTEAQAKLERLLAEHPDYAEAWANKALLLGQEKRFAEAITFARRGLDLKPHLDQLWALLASLHVQLRQWSEAIEAYERAIDLAGEAVDVARLADLGECHRQTGHIDRAIAILERAVAHDPGFFPAWVNYGTALQAAGRRDDAKAAYQRALAIQPQSPEILNNLGAFAKDDGDWEKALRCFEQALAIAPDQPAVLANKATALAALERHEEAEAVARKACERDPNNIEAWCALASVLTTRDRLHEAEEALAQAERRLGEASIRNVAFCSAKASLCRKHEAWEEAEAWARRAVAAKPQDAGVWRQLGGILDQRERPAEAREALERALALKAEDAATLQALAGHCARQEAWEEAEAWARRAVAAKPQDAGALRRLSGILVQQDVLDEAFGLLDRALSAGDRPLRNRFAYWLAMPSIMPALADIPRWRARYERGLAELAAMEGELSAGDLSEVSPSSFNLAYHDADDRALLEGLSRLFRAKAPPLNFVSPHVEAWRGPRGRRVRVGICSEYLRGHTIGKLYQGFVRHLDRSRFEVVVIYPPGSRRDPVRSAIEGMADRAVQLPGGLVSQQRAVSELGLDVLFYPDIGMSPATWYLAHARLAPVQVVSYGHPDTTGISTLDYFYGGDVPLEAEGSEAQYAEHLIRSPRLPFCYQLFALPTVLPSRAELGLPEGVRLYGCPQSLFKIHPEFDAVLAAIAEADPEGRLVFLEGRSAAWTRRLRERWSRTAPILLERAIFLPRVPLDRFMGLMAHFDVLLDPIHFGSGNTLYEGMAYGTPIVTWPGRFARGRFVAAAYCQMGLREIAPIASSIAAYAEVAVAWGRDRERREAFRARALAARSELYGDVAAVRLFETFLEAALAAAERGERLPRGWRVPMAEAGVRRAAAGA